MRIGLAFKAFFAILSEGSLPDELLKELKLRRELTAGERETTAPKEDPRKRESEAIARAVQLLAIFQRDARLIDFLREDIRPYSDAQVGAAVRSMHESC